MKYLVLFLNMALIASGLGAQSKPTLGGQNVDPNAKPDISISVTELNNGYRVEALYLLPAGMHQYLQEKYFTLEFEGLGEGWTLGKVNYPPTSESTVGIASYSGSVKISRELSFGGANRPQISDQTKIIAKYQICYDTGVCLRPGKVVVDFLNPSGTTVQAPKEADPEPTSVAELSFGLLILFSLLGGIILNLMPCVLPVISIKLLSIIKISGENAALRRTHGLAGLLGTVSSMLVLALIVISLKAAGSSVGWGFYFQTPLYPIILGAILLVFALNLFGMWELPSPSIKQSNKKGLWSSFFSGVLAVILATPCTAPFLGSAVGAALSSPWYVIVLSFALIGLGLGLPLFVLTVFPGLSKFVPKSGNWMNRVRVLMGFALIATLVWLLSVVAAQIGANQAFSIMFGLLGLGFAFWIIGFFKELSSKLAKFFALLFIVVGIGFSIFMTISTLSQKPEISSSTNLPAPWQKFDEDKVKADIGQNIPVFIDFTAAWCVTCHINEDGPLSDPQVLGHFNSLGAKLYRGDWTYSDPIIEKWLAQYKRSGVPFYLFIDKVQMATVLPELLSVDMLLKL